MDEGQRPTFVFEQRVAFADTDMAGILHFASFFRYIEEAEHAFLRSLGLSVFESDEGGVISWPRVSAQCDYHSPARFEDVLRIAVSVEKLGEKSVTYRFDITVDGRTIATGRTVVVCCRVHPDHRIESIPIPARIAERLRG